MPPGPKWATYTSCVPTDLKALPSDLSDYNGSVATFDTFAVALTFYLCHAKFVVQFAPTTFDKLPIADKTVIIEEQRQFEETYGPLGLRSAHMDTILILKYIFEKFPPMAPLVNLRAIEALN